MPIAYSLIAPPRYELLKESLENPRPSFFPVDPFWTANLLPPDHEWPTLPGRVGIDNVQIAFMIRMGHKQKVLGALIAAESIMFMLAKNPDDFRHMINPVYDFLRGEEVTSEFYEHARDVTPDGHAGMRRSARSCVMNTLIAAADNNALYVADAVCDAADALSDEAQNRLAPPHPAHYTLQELRRMADSIREQYFTRWWSAFRRMLSFAQSPKADFTIDLRRR